MSRKYSVALLLVLSAVWIRWGVGPSYISPDGSGYFSYLHSILVDQDLDFENEFRELKWPMPLVTTPTGYLSNIWPVGTAWLLSPLCILGQVWYHFFGRAIGQSPLQWLLIFFNLGSGLYGCAAVWLCFLELKDSGLTAQMSWGLALASFLGTPLLFYSFSAPSTSHAVSALMVSLFLLFWIRSVRQNDQSLGRWFFLGLLLGAGGTVRTENLIYMMAPLCEWVYLMRSPDSKIRVSLKFLGVYSLGVLLGFSPQLYCWKILYGRFFSSPQVFNLSRDNFALTDVLFSPFHGLLPWTPLFLVGFLGLALTMRRNFLHLALFLCVLAQVLLSSFAVAWWGGYSFGIRVLTGCFFPMALGLGILVSELNRSSPRRARVALALFAGLALWTFSLCLQAMIGWIDLSDFVLSWGTILKWQGRILEAAAVAFTRFFRNRYLSNLEFILVFFSVWGVGGFLWVLHRFFQKRLIPSLAIGLTGFILLFHLKLFQAQRHGPQIRSEIPSVQADLSKDFLIQALHARWYYELSRNDLSRARRTIDRHLQMDAQSIEAQQALRYVNRREGR